MSAAATAPHDPPHVPVLIDAIISAVAPVNGVWLDGTFGNGGYSRALIEAGAERVIGVDRDPRAHALAADWIDEYEGRITLISDTFSNLDAHGSDLDGVVFDLGVSSMQIDEAERGFSFQKDGPLDMRMSQDGISAADIVNRADEGAIADILFRFGEERASRRIAKAIVAARPVETTLQLAEIVSGCLPRPKPGQSHPATRSFQALRIAVNDEYGELIAGLEAAERALKPGGTLAVVTFHSIEDRMVKRFFQERGGAKGQGSRHAPVTDAVAPGFVLKSRKAVVASGDEVAVNPRARSAKLRIGIRTDALAAPVARSDLGMPVISKPYGGIH